MDDATMAKCRICLKARGLEELTLQDTLPKSRISIADAVKKSFNIDVSQEVPRWQKNVTEGLYVN